MTTVIIAYRGNQRIQTPVLKGSFISRVHLYEKLSSRLISEVEGSCAMANLRPLCADKLPFTVLVMALTRRAVSCDVIGRPAPFKSDMFSYEF